LPKSTSKAHYGTNKLVAMPHSINIASPCAAGCRSSNDQTACVPFQVDAAAQFISGVGSIDVVIAVDTSWHWSPWQAQVRWMSSCD
jgi:hypothetical protein